MDQEARFKARLEREQKFQQRLQRETATSQPAQQPPTLETPEEPTEAPWKGKVRKAAGFAPLAGGIAGTFVKPGFGTAAGAMAGQGIKEATLSALGDRDPSLLGATARVAGSGALGAVGGQTLRGAATAGKMAVAGTKENAVAGLVGALKKSGAEIPHSVAPSTAKGIVDFVNTYKSMAQASSAGLAKKSAAELYELRQKASTIMNALRMGGDHAKRVKAGLPEAVKPDLVKIKKAADAALEVVAPGVKKALTKMATVEARNAVATKVGKGATMAGKALGLGAAGAIAYRGLSTVLPRK